MFANIDGIAMYEVAILHPLSRSLSLRCFVITENASMAVCVTLSRMRIIPLNSGFHSPKPPAPSCHAQKGRFSKSNVFALADPSSISFYRHQILTINPLIFPSHFPHLEFPNQTFLHHNNLSSYSYSLNTSSKNSSLSSETPIASLP